MNPKLKHESKINLVNNSILIWTLDRYLAIQVRVTALFQFINYYFVSTTARKIYFLLLSIIYNNLKFIGKCQVIGAVCGEWTSESFSSTKNKCQCLSPLLYWTKLIWAISEIWNRLKWMVKRVFVLCALNSIDSPNVCNKVYLIQTIDWWWV